MKKKRIDRLRRSGWWIVKLCRIGFTLKSDPKSMLPGSDYISLLGQFLAKIPLIMLLLILPSLLVGCSFIDSFLGRTIEPVNPKATTETRALLTNLEQIRQEKILFGHQDTLAYGVYWHHSDNGKSDVKAVTGSYPALYGWDVGDLELNAVENLDGNKFDDMRDWIVKAYKRGGVITISWHMNNPASKGNAWDIAENQQAVSKVLPGGELHEKYKSWLDRFAEFAKSLYVSQGEQNEHLVPIIFRPFHEYNGDWFWWGAEHCTPQEFKQLWQFTFEYLTETKDVHNLLWALSSAEVDSREEYLKRYPGNDYVDILGIDDYASYKEPYNYDDAVAMAQMIVELAEEKGKLPALTETGYEAIPDAQWWTDVLLKVLTHDETTKRLAWVMVWRNANAALDRPGHYYAPYPGHPSADNFLDFYNSELILFEDDLPDLYKR